MKEKKRIIHIAQANGGVERYLKMFFKYWNNSNYENYLIVSEQYRDSVVDFENLGVKTYVIEMKREINIISDLKSIINIYKIIKTERPNIVYTHSSKAGGLGRIPAKLLGCKSVYNPHGWAFDMNMSNEKRMLFKYIEKYSSLITDKIVAISPYERDVAIKNNITSENKINIIENAIDLENSDPVDKNIIIKNLEWRETDIIIGMVARISNQKSPETFIDIAEKLNKKIPGCRFVLVGDGEKRSVIEELIRKKGLEDKFFITGWIDNVEDYINIFDVALLTSKWEGFGLVIPEYMACKKPVVASNIGGITNIIDHYETGFLVDDLNVDKFVEYISIVLFDENIRKKIINNAYIKVKSKYDFKRVIYQHLDMFDKMMNM